MKKGIFAILFILAVAAAAAQRGGPQKTSRHPANEVERQAARDAIIRGFPGPENTEIRVPLAEAYALQPVMRIDNLTTITHLIGPEIKSDGSIGTTTLEVTIGYQVKVDTGKTTMTLKPGYRIFMLDGTALRDLQVNPLR